MAHRPSAAGKLQRRPPPLHPFFCRRAFLLPCVSLPCRVLKIAGCVCRGIVIGMLIKLAGMHSLAVYSMAIATIRCG